MVGAGGVAQTTTEDEARRVWGDAASLRADGADERQAAARGTNAAAALLVDAPRQAMAKEEDARLDASVDCIFVV